MPWRWGSVPRCGRGLRPSLGRPRRSARSLVEVRGVVCVLPSTDGAQFERESRCAAWSVGTEASERGRWRMRWLVVRGRLGGWAYWRPVCVRGQAPRSSLPGGGPGRLTPDMRGLTDPDPSRSTVRVGWCTTVVLQVTRTSRGPTTQLDSPRACRKARPATPTTVAPPLQLHSLGADEPRAAPRPRRSWTPTTPRRQCPYPAQSAHAPCSTTSCSATVNVTRRARRWIDRSSSGSSNGITVPQSSQTM
jgi:hypothetical protein